jgi:hypothetical protein
VSGLAVAYCDCVSPWSRWMKHLPPAFRLKSRWLGVATTCLDTATSWLTLKFTDGETNALNRHMQKPLAGTDDTIRPKRKNVLQQSRNSAAD